MTVLLTLRFVAELGMLACLAWGGWQRAPGLLISLLLAVGLPLVAAATWGLLISPRAPRRLPDPQRLGLEVALFVLAVLTVVNVDPSPQSTVFGAGVGALFLVSIPSRGHEPLPPTEGASANRG